MSSNIALSACLKALSRLTYSRSFLSASVLVANLAASAVQLRNPLRNALSKVLYDLVALN
jgi:hypothetical protein